MGRLHPRYLLFDLDETLYPASNGLMPAVSRRMTEFVSRFLALSAEEAGAQRRLLSREYGTTLNGLLRRHGLKDPGEFLGYVHRVDLSRYLSEDRSLAAALEAIPLPKSVLTNSPAEHAERVLRRLGIRGLFQRVFDIAYNGYNGKPHPSTYRMVLAEIGCRPQEVLLVDNRRDCLEGFAALGGAGVLIEETASGARWRDGFPVLKDVKELGRFLSAAARR